MKKSRVAVIAIGDTSQDDGRMETNEERMTQRLMSRSAQLAYFAIRQTLVNARWESTGEDLGLFMGVGASGADMEQLRLMLVASQKDKAFDLNAFGGKGLRACNPLFAFSLMNNFTLAHSAALQGIRGPNAVLFSRGVGTVAALEEAVAALEEGSCSRAIVGGADSAIHPVTAIENERMNVQCALGGELLPACEGATVFALAAATHPAQWCVEEIVQRCRTDKTGIQEVFSQSLSPPCENVFIWTPWADFTRQLTTRASVQGTVTSIVNADHCLAATPPSAWKYALEHCTEGATSIAVVTVDIDGSCGVVRLLRETP